MTWPGKDLTPLQRLFQAARALVTSNAVVYERNTDVRSQMNAWEVHHGTRLTGKWVRIVHAHGPVRYVRQGVGQDESGDTLPQGASVVATFKQNADARPIATWIEHGLRQINVRQDDWTRSCVGSALVASAPGGQREVIENLSAHKSASVWGFNWPPDGSPPSEDLETALVEYRNALSADGSLMAGVGATIELYNELKSRRLAGKQMADVARPLRDALYDNAPHIMQASIFTAADFGQGQAAFELFRSYSTVVSDGVYEATKSANLDDYQEALFRLMPAAIAAVNIGDLLLKMPWVPESAKAGIAGRRNVVEEHRVRMVDGVTEHTDNLITDGGAWEKRLVEIRTAFKEGGRSAAERRAQRMVTEDRLYPQSCLDLILRDAEVMA